MAVPATTKVVTRITPFKSFVLQADPDFEAAKRNEPFYEFTNRNFTGDNSKKGPYAPPNS
jgi:adenine specific DNA methylase Mod